MQSFKFEGPVSRLEPVVRASQSGKGRDVDEMLGVIMSLVGAAQTQMPLVDIPESGDLPDNNVRVEVIVADVGGYFRRSVDVFVRPPDAT